MHLAALRRAICGPYMETKPLNGRTWAESRPAADSLVAAFVAEATTAEPIAGQSRRAELRADPTFGT